MGHGMLLQWARTWPAHVSGLGYNALYHVTPEHHWEDHLPPLSPTFSSSTWKILSIGDDQGNSNQWDTQVISHPLVRRACIKNPETTRTFAGGDEKRGSLINALGLPSAPAFWKTVQRFLKSIKKRTTMWASIFTPRWNGKSMQFNSTNLNRYLKTYAH